MSESNGAMHFDDAAPQEVPFTVGARRFVICEANTAIYRKYRDGMSREITVNPETRKVSAGAPAAAQIKALASSLREIKPGKSGQGLRVIVQQDTVDAWKPAVTKWAWAKLCEISPGLSIEDDEGAKKLGDSLKNSPSNGTPSSDTVESTAATSTT